MDVESLLDEARDRADMVRPLGKIFAFGCGKSGTTWLRNLLNGHPHIVIRGEGGFVYQLLPLIKQAFEAFNQHQRHLPAYTRMRDIELMITLRRLIDWQLSRYIQDAGVPIESLRFVGDKTPQHAISVPVLNQLYPSARFVHIIRDPRDAANSAWFHFGRTSGRSLPDYARYWIETVWATNVSLARRAGPALTDRYHELRYEDLHANEEAELLKLLRFLGATHDAETLNACREAGSFRKHSGGRERGQGDANAHYRKGQVGDWRNNLPLDVVRSACEKVAPLMRECGYDPNCDVEESNAATALAATSLQ
ncbi:MAG: sulfotransferase [Phycisphaerales bacterium]|nr:sulfotransferase [Phycisphaerales bacterium]